MRLARSLGWPDILLDLPALSYVDKYICLTVSLPVSVAFLYIPSYATIASSSIPKCVKGLAAVDFADVNGKRALRRRIAWVRQYPPLPVQPG